MKFYKLDDKGVKFETDLTLEKLYFLHNVENCVICLSFLPGKFGKPNYNESYYGNRIDAE